MKLAKVYHRLNSRFEEVKAFNPNLYKLVAEVEVSGINFMPDLENAYKLTNHINSSWQGNQKVIPHDHHARSTSVGDVVELSDRFYTVANCGFVEIKEGEIV
jgi:hypothetical protein